MPYRDSQRQADYLARYRTLYERKPNKRKARGKCHDQLPLDAPANGEAPAIGRQVPLLRDTRRQVPLLHEDEKVAKRLTMRDTRATVRNRAHMMLAEYQEAHPADGVLEWARAHYQTGIVPSFNAPRYARDWLALSCHAPPDLREVHLRKASQLGYTTTLGAYLGWCLARGGRRVCVVQPTDGDARAFRRDTITPMFSSIDELRLAADTVKADQNTAEYKEFDNSSMRVIGGLEPGHWRRFVADVLLIDERDAFRDNIGGDETGEGDISVLAQRPLQNRRGRLITGGTPTSARGPSAITRDALGAELAMVYMVQCPSCGELDDLAWERLHWRKDLAGIGAAAATALHHCGRCGDGWAHGGPGGTLWAAIEGGRWVEAHSPDDAPFPVPLDGGRWLDTRRGVEPVVRGADGEAAPWPHSIGLNIHGVYSHWRTWPEMVVQWLGCQDDSTKRRGFVEQQLGRPWRRTAESVEERKLQRLAQPIDGIPHEATTIILSMDVQKGFLSMLVTAWARPRKAWVLERHEFVGDTDKIAEGAWLEMASWLTRFATTIGTRRLIFTFDVGYIQNTVMRSMLALDKAGMMPASERFAIKGVDGWGRPALRVTATVGGFRIHICGIYDVKKEQISDLAAGNIVLSDALDSRVFKELAGEEIQYTRVRGRRAQKFVQTTSAIEASDCLTYALAVWKAMHVV